MHEGKDVKIGFSEKDRKRMWKNHMEIMNKENDWNHIKEASMIKGPIEKVTPEKKTKAIKPIKPGKAVGPSEEWEEIISARGEAETSVMIELCKCVFDEKGMPTNGKQMC